MSDASTRPSSAPRLADLGVPAGRPLLVVDVDEVLGLFLKAFMDFLDENDVEFRIESYALFDNMFRSGTEELVSPADGRDYYDRFFRKRCTDLEPAPGAVAALDKLSRHASIVVLSNAPSHAESGRADWLAKHALRYPLVINSGPKGPVTAALVAQAGASSAFVDDLIVHLDSVADCSPHTATFQHVADPRLRPLAPRSDRHRRIDDWTQLGEAIEAALRA